MTLLPPLRVVTVSGGLHPPSRTAALAGYLSELITARLPCTQQRVELGELAPHFSGTVRRAQLPGPVEAALVAVEQADVLVVATPVYRGTYSGLFKHFFDFVDQHALIDTPVLLAATGGSERHALMIDHQLRPLFSFFQARTLPLGVYATDKDFEGHDLSSKDLIERARLAVERALPVIALAHRKMTKADNHAAIA